MRRFLFGTVVLGLFVACASGIKDNDGGSGSSSVTSGSGGSPTTSPASSQANGPASTSGPSGTPGAGGGGPGVGGASSSGTGGMNNCLHDVCTEGPALTIGCGDPCVDTVCAQDSYCCDTDWDSVCVEEAVDFCSAMCAVPMMPGDVVITEIMNNPAAVADTAGEWFEVLNISSNTIDLQGFSILHQANMPTAVETINQSVVLAPGQYAVLGVNADPLTNGNVAVDYQYSASVSLNNTTDYLAIQDAALNIIDEVTYSETSGLDPNGKTRNLDPLFMSAFDNDTDMHFCEATTTIVGGTDLGTPGAQNDACPP